MSDENAFLLTVRRRPHDCVVKVVYADWLDDRGRGVEADAWRWMGEKNRWPAWKPQGQSYGSKTKGINYAWYWMFTPANAWAQSRGHYLVPMPLWEAIEYSPNGVERAMMAWTQGKGGSFLAHIKLLVAWKRITPDARAECWRWKL